MYGNEELESVEKVDFKFHFDPYKEDDRESSNFTTFDDYNNLMDQSLSEADRHYYW